MNGFSELWLSLPSRCQYLLQMGIGIFLQSTLLLLCGGAGYLLVRRRGPLAQRFVCQTTLLGVAGGTLLSFGLAGRLPALLHLSLPPAQTLPLAGFSSRVPSEHDTLSALRSDMPVAAGSVGRVGEAQNAARVDVLPEKADVPVARGSAAFLPAFRGFLSSEHVLQTSRFGWLYVAVVGIWLAGAVGLLGWLLLCYAGIARLRRRSILVEETAVRDLLNTLCAAQSVPAPALWASAEVQSVFLVGSWRPAILLPATWRMDFDATTLRAVLMHEIGHLALRDTFWTLFGRLMCAVGWIHPLLWRLCHLREQASEEVCDQMVLHGDGSRRAYADCLLRLAERRLPAPAERCLGNGIVSFRSSLARRIQKIMDGSAEAMRPLSQKLRNVVTLGVLTLVALLTLMVSATATSQDTLANDSRLEQKVAIRAEGVPVGELLALIVQKTGVAIDADSALADEKIVVFSPPRPLREVMADIVALFNNVWGSGNGPDGKMAYRMVRSQRAKEYEEQLDGEGERRLRTQLEMQIQALRESPEQFAKRPPNDPIRQALSTPQGRAATSVFALLTPQQKALLLERWHLRFPASALNPMQKEQLGDLFHGPEVKKDANGIGPDPIPLSEMDKHEITFGLLGNWGEYRQEGTLRVILSAPTGLYAIVTIFHASAKFPLPPHGNPYTGRPIPREAALPEAPVIRGVTGKDWIDRLQTLSEKTGQPVLADSYRSKPINIAAAEEEVLSPETPIGALDALCRSEGYLWWNRGNTLLMRKRDWYHQRQYEVPDRWIQAMLARLKAQKGVPTYGDVFRLLELSTSQIVGLIESAGGIADRRLMAGLRELLTAAAASPVRRETPLYTGVLRDAATINLAAVKPNTGDPRQTALVNDFLDAFNRRFLKDAAELQQLQFLFQGLPEKSGSPDAHTMRLGIHLNVGDSIHAGYLLTLPLRLPDDRRDKTRIELAP